MADASACDLAMLRDDLGNYSIVLMENFGAMAVLRVNSSRANQILQRITLDEANEIATGTKDTN